QKQKKLIMLPSETMIWQPEFTDKTLSRKPGAVQVAITAVARELTGFMWDIALAAQSSFSQQKQN
ncbi:hypothetical protein ACRWTT_28300, partial [Escherichia coli]